MFSLISFKIQRKFANKENKDRNLKQLHVIHSIKVFVCSVRLYFEDA